MLWQGPQVRQSLSIECSGRAWNLWRAVAEKRSVCAGGLSELYEAQERAVLQEYQSILQKILERVNKKAADDGAPGALPNPALAERGRGGMVAEHCLSAWLHVVERSSWSAM